MGGAGWGKGGVAAFCAPWEWAGGRMEGGRSVADELECSAALPGEQTHAAEAKEKGTIKKMRTRAGRKLLFAPALKNSVAMQATACFLHFCKTHP